MVAPEAVVPGRLDLLFASPEGKFFSRAHGGKSIHEQSWMNPWAIHDRLAKLDVNCVLVEDVPEFVNCGPLDEDDKPINARRNEYFQAWFSTFPNIRYEAQLRNLNAADFCGATSRKRFSSWRAKIGILWCGRQLPTPAPSRRRSGPPRSCCRRCRHGGETAKLLIGQCRRNRYLMTPATSNTACRRVPHDESPGAATST